MKNLEGRIICFNINGSICANIENIVDVLMELSTEFEATEDYISANEFSDLARKFMQLQNKAYAPKVTC